MRSGITLSATIIGLAFAGCEPTDVQGISSNAACDIDYGAIKTAEMIGLEIGLSIYTRFVVEKLSEDSLSAEDIASLERMQTILDSRTRPVDRQDLMILESADEQLLDSTVWDRADDRTCEPQEETYSLYCSLYFGSINTIGEYQHRRTAIQEVRFAIEDATAGRNFKHRLMDFNNLPETSFDDIKDVIKTATERVRNRLDLQAKCALQ